MQRFAAIPSKAVRDKTLPLSVRWTLECYAVFADGDGWCWPNLKTIAEIRGVSPQQISKDVQVLAARGYIKIFPRYDQYGGRRSNKYQLILDYPDSADDVKNPEGIDDLDTPPQPPEIEGGLNSQKLRGPQPPEVEVNTLINTPISNTPILERSVPEIHVQVEEEVYVDDPFEEETNESGKPKWAIPRSELAKRALRACGAKYYPDKQARSSWLEIEKAILPISTGITSIYPTEWVEEIIAWAEKANAAYRKQYSRYGVRVTFPSLLKAIRNEERKLIWISKAEKNIGIDDDSAEFDTIGLVDDEELIA